MGKQPGDETVGQTESKECYWKRVDEFTGLKGDNLAKFVVDSLCWEREADHKRERERERERER